MLPEPLRLRRHGDFTQTVRRGQRIGRRDIVVHALLEAAADEVDGPRFGLIVNKAVGSAVVRHRVARRLRHVCASIADQLPVRADVVIRALPGAADISSRDLESQVRSGLAKLMARRL